jgi:dipeptidyl aminopeptidase/acylaminoacyl peptidase
VRQASTRLIFDHGDHDSPVWTPDGRRVVFSSRNGGPANLYWKTADGTGRVERLTTSPNMHVAQSFHPDGKSLIFAEFDSLDAQASPYSTVLYVLSMQGERRAKRLFGGSDATFSPDGRWLAYTSWDSGHPEVRVRPFPNTEEGVWQISGRGIAPVWAPKKHELFYWAGQDFSEFTVVRYETQPAFTPGSPQKLFARTYLGTVRNYDLAPDGRRFLMLKQHVQSGRNEFVAVLNWLQQPDRAVSDGND